MKTYPCLNRYGLLAVIFVFWLLAAITGCGGNSNTARLQAEVDSLNKAVTQSYKPGLGEFMMGIQTHHAKIWFAGKNQNWALADFEEGEIRETLEAVKKYCTDRPEIKSLPIIYPALDSLSSTIKAKNPRHFEDAFTYLTASCNSCHKSTQHGFNVIKLPDVPPITNQDYKGE